MMWRALLRARSSEQFAPVEHTTFSVSDNPELRLVLFLAAGAVLDRKDQKNCRGVPESASSTSSGAGR